MCYLICNEGSTSVYTYIQQLCLLAETVFGKAMHPKESASLPFLPSNNAKSGLFTMKSHITSFRGKVKGPTRLPDTSPHALAMIQIVPGY